MSDVDRQLEKMAHATAELRALTRQAHEAAQELTAVIKQARTMVDEYAAREVEKVMNGHLATTQMMISEWTADASADVHGFIARLAEVARGIVTVVRMKLEVEPVTHEMATADVVIDLRGEAPQMFAGHDPEAIRLLRDAPYKVIVGPANQRGADRT